MDKLWFLFYNVLILPLFKISINILSLINRKIRIGLKERDNLFDKLKTDLDKLDPSKKILWFHSSSSGEFEQAKPIIEEINKTNQFNTVASFFSPSGYHIAKRYEHIQCITYYPFDSLTNIKKFINLIKPSALIIMRYDIWPNSIWELSRRNIPIFLVDATMKKNSPRKLPLVKSFHSSLFKHFTKIITISSEDRDGFLHFNLDPKKIEVAGDTRYDRVYQKSLSALTQKIINEEIIKGKKIFVAGSTWKEDEDVLFPVLIKLHQNEKDLISILVPHEPTVQNLDQIEFELKNKISNIRFSRLNQYNGEKVIIVDSVGILLILYAYADVAFVGGGFKSNIHNVLEPAVYGIPVLFGPKYLNSQEAYALIRKNGGFSVKDKLQMYKLLRKLFMDENYRQNIGKNAKCFVESNTGATLKIVSSLNHFL